LRRDPATGVAYSHLRPLEDLISAQRLDRLVAAVCSTGGLVSTRRKADGTDSPYELNISYFSAMGTIPSLTSQTHVRRFLASQAIMLALRGIPAVYFHSLVGTPNDAQGVQRSGRARTINRRKFDWHELQELLTPEQSVQRQVFESYCRMLAVRLGQSAFHPDADQEVLDVDNRSVIAFVRTSVDGCQQILVTANVADTTVSIHVPPSFAHSRANELICLGATWQAGNYLSLAPGGFAWLTRTP
jgi:sucrose phosphorylase